MPFDGDLTQLRVEVGGLTLRAPSAEDIENVMAVYDDDFNLEPQPRPETNLERARQGVLHLIARNPHARRGAQWCLELLVEAAPGAVIGWATLVPDDDEPGRQLETATWVAPHVRRRGHARTIRSGLLALAFSGLDADVALSRAQPANLGSNRISEGLGYAQGPTTYTSRKRVAYTNWSLTKAAWTQAAQPNGSEVRGHEPFRDWLNRA